MDEKEIDSKVEAARNEINSLINDDSHQSPLIEKWKLDFERLNIDLISSLIGVEQDIASILLDGFGTIVKIFTASRSELIKIEGIDNTIIEKIIQQSEQD